MGPFYYIEPTSYIFQQQFVRMQLYGESILPSHIKLHHAHVGLYLSMMIGEKTILVPREVLASYLSPTTEENQNWAHQVRVKPGIFLDLFSYRYYTLTSYGIKLQECQVLRSHIFTSDPHCQSLSDTFERLPEGTRVPEIQVQKCILVMYYNFYDSNMKDSPCGMFVSNTYVNFHNFVSECTRL
jgi:hypothetical protein